MPYEVALTYRDDDCPRRVTLIGVMTDPEAVAAVTEYFQESSGPLPSPVRRTDAGSGAALAPLRRRRSQRGRVAG